MIMPGSHGFADSHVDVIVIGGGPAGATCATLLAQQGLKVRLFERENGPRFHIGESLLPASYHTLKRLNLLDHMKSSRFTKKYSVQFVSESGKESQPFYFFDANPHESSQTWQVVRSEFDRILIDNAVKHGVDVRQGYRVLDVIFEGTTAKGVKVQDPAGTKFDVTADVVVDASGQSTMISNRLKLREPDAFLKKASVWTYVEGAFREPGEFDEGATLVIYTPSKKGWFWYIPLHNNILSVGVVSSIEHLFGETKDLAAIYEREVNSCPAIKRRIEVGRRVTPYYTTKDFSYKSSTVAGDRWVLIGDAFGFLDPIYSSGVLLALRSGEFAADAIAEGFAKRDLSPEQLSSWGPGFVQGMDRMRRLVYAFYEGLSFGQFIRRYPHCKNHIIDLLSGDLFKDSLDEVIEPLESMRSPQMTASEER